MKISSKDNLQEQTENKDNLSSVVWKRMNFTFNMDVCKVWKTKNSDQKVYQ